METTRNCNNCVYKDWNWREEPCASCDRNCSAWAKAHCLDKEPSIISRALRNDINSAYDFTSAVEYQRPSYHSYNRIPPITKVIFNDPATIVLWGDGTKTVVKCQDFDLDYDPEKGLAMCICKKVMGNSGRYYNVFNEWLPQAEVMTPNEIREHMELEPSKEEIDILQTKNAVDECDIEKRCRTCRHWAKSIGEHPCLGCFKTPHSRPNWEPKDEVTE